ncbi:MAG: hypothetical protein KDK27_02630 [Leptospiraceae bacterium]|nr:hypothetical protein [Leptospiraceae bacterium]
MLAVLLGLALPAALMARDDEDSTPEGAGAQTPPSPVQEDVLDGPSLYGPEDFRYEENYFGLDQEGKSRLVDRIQWRVKFWNHFNYVNDTDLRQLNEDNETSIDETDDRAYFIVAGAALDTFFPINPYLDVRVDIWKTGFWGHDQLAGRDNNNDSRDTFSGSNTVNFGKLFLDIHIKPEPDRTSRADLTIGRQHYGLGGYIENDYIFDDTVDAVVFRWYGRLGRLDLLILDVYANGSDVDDINFVQYISHDSEKQEGFNGDVNTYRQGLTYRFPIYGDEELGGTHFDVRAFYYYAQFGALDDGGSDRTNEGASGNFSDEDFSFLRGARLNAGYSS